MECYACSNEATRQCRRCARVYCEVHGGDLCAECLSPASSLPSFNLYRGSLLALLVATAVALWLLVRPPGSGDGQEVVITEFTPTTIVTQVLSTSTPSTPAPTMRTPAARETATPAASATPELRQYIVQEGDTLIGIAEQFAPPGVDAFEYAGLIVAASDSLASADDPLSPGQTLVLP
jgi:hypothetical protein